jgi:hypothetical protein
VARSLFFFGFGLLAILLLGFFISFVRFGCGFFDLPPGRGGRLFYLLVRLLDHLPNSFGRCRMLTILVFSRL